ncbi:MAG: hypothetical protein JNJ71_05685 [Rubrivivax sp.]|nr:hypothetical protein [Rubrivivax sp.]
MYLIALAWMYVVLMMAIAEAMSPQGGLIGATFTFLLYGVLPLSVLLYILGTPLRRRRMRRLEAEQAMSERSDDDGSHAAADSVSPVRKEV